MTMSKIPAKTALKKVAKAPFKFAGAVVENLAAPIIMSPYQIATDAVVHNKLKDPFKYKHDVEFAGLNIPVSHELDASKSSIDRGFSFKRGGFTTDYDFVLDHEISLGNATPIPEPIPDPIPEPIPAISGGDYSPSKYSKNHKPGMSSRAGTGIHPLHR